MSLLPVTEYEFTKGNKFNINNAFVKEGIKSLEKKGLIREEENERVIEIDELFLEMYKVMIKADKYRCNTNGRKK